MRTIAIFSFFLFLSFPVFAGSDFVCSYSDTKKYTELYKRINSFYELIDCLKLDFKAIETDRIRLEENRIKLAATVGSVLVFDDNEESFGSRYKRSKQSFENYRKNECGEDPFSEVVSYAAIKMAICSIVITKHRIEILEQE